MADSNLWIFLILGLFSGISCQIDLKYELVEEERVGSYVGDVKTDAKLYEKFNTTELEELKFQFISTPSIKVFIEETTGIIRTNDRIDRDEICPQEEVCEIELNVAVKHPKSVDILAVMVKVIDSNDNPPTFPESFIKYEILESVSPGKSFLVPNAEDPDSPRFSIQRYELVAATNNFKLKTTTKADGSVDVRLILQEFLNREEEDFYQLQIIAYDGGIPVRTGTLDVNVAVLDTNDNSPVFQESNYEVTIYENINPQTSIIRVQAKDADQGTNGEVLYSFSEQTQESYGNIFNVNNLTGEVFVIGTVNYEMGSVLLLNVLATDRGLDAIPTDVTITVNIQDVNNHAPDITVNSLAAKGTDRVEIPEGSNIGTFVAHISVKDKDTGKNGEFNCSLNDKDFKLFKIRQTEYQIKTAKDLDKEDRFQYSLGVVCQDGGIPEPLIAVKYIDVIITDINDHAPVFVQDNFEGELEENNFVGSVILRVNATDLDVGINADIRYSLHSDAGDLFAIDPVTGTITARAVFDYEKTKSLKFRVVATDQGEPSKFGTTFVTIKIKDVNDERPKFSQENYSLGVFENEQPGSEVGIVSAFDADGEPHNTFEFSLMPSRTALNVFAINKDSGKITTLKSLDRETQSVYYLQVLATDKGTPPLSSSASVSIYVADKNDNAPKFSFPSDENNTVFVSSHVPKGYNITKARAHDRDVGDNSYIQYKMMPNSKNKKFTVDSNTGMVSTAEDLSDIKLESFNLTILATDKGYPSKSGFAHIRITVNSSLAYYSDLKQSTQLLTGPNFIIVISLACVLGLIMVILIICIVAICKRDSQRRRNSNKYFSPTPEVILALDDNCEKDKSGDEIIPSDSMLKDSKEKRMNNSFSSENERFPKKEVSFSMDMDSFNPGSFRGQSSGRDLHKQRSYPVKMDSFNSNTLERNKPTDIPPQLPEKTQNNIPQPWTTNTSGGVTNSHPQNWHPSYKKPSTSSNQWPAGWPTRQPREPDQDSASSGEVSNADSGRGPSEEGEGHHHHHHQGQHHRANKNAADHPPPRPARITTLKAVQV